MTYVLGHANPDTDSVCSAIAYSRIKNHTPLIFGKPSEEALFVLRQFNMQIPEQVESIEGMSVVLVDHNEKEHSAKGYENANIIEVIDHHRIGFKNDKTIKFTARPVGSTATIISQEYANMDQNTAGLLLSAILSDTLLFRSNTTSEQDKQEAIRLAKIARIDLQRWGEELIRVKTNIQEKSPRELIEDNNKKTMLNNYTIEVSKIVVMDFEQVEKYITDFRNVLDKNREERKLSASALIIVSLKNNKTRILVSSDRVTKLGNKKLVQGIATFNGMQSRHGDVLPLLKSEL